MFSAHFHAHGAQAPKRFWAVEILNFVDGGKA
jgi:hypothetical protein